MPRNKDLKRLVRARMEKTGEAYTAARARLLRKSQRGEPAAPAPDHAAIAGIADERIREKTGRTWAEWTRLLDDEGARDMTHRDVAVLVSKKYAVPDWWSQTVTVGYERITGKRAVGQRMDGTYEANKSRTYAVPVGTLFQACASAAKRRRWLGASGIRMRTATKPKYMRLDFGDGTIVVLGFLAKGKGRSSVAVQHQKLPSRERASQLKSFWSGKLDALGEMLSRRPGTT